MRLKLTLGIAATCLLAANVSQASRQIEPLVMHIDMNDRGCTIQAAGAAEQRAEAAYFIPILQKQTGNLDRWQMLMKSRKWREGVPMGQQMTPPEALTFERLQQETKVGLLSWLVEDIRTRDVRVFIAGARAAEKMDIHGQFPNDEASDAFIIATLLAGSRDISALKSDDEARLLAETGNCTFERALIAEARRVKRIAENPAEADKAKSMLSYFADLLLLARLEHVSKLRRDVRRQSQLEAPGDADHFNVVWGEWRRKNRISDYDNRLTGVLDYIGEKIPTEFAKDAASKSQAANHAP